MQAAAVMAADTTPTGNNKEELEAMSVELYRQGKCLLYSSNTEYNTNRAV